MKRVATVIAAPHWGGLQTVVERTTPAIREAGYERIVILPVAAERTRERLEASGARVIDFRMRRPRKSLNPKLHLDYVSGFSADVAHLAQIFRDEGIGVVEVAGLLNLQPVIAAKRARTSLVWQMHSTLAPYPLRLSLGVTATAVADVVMTSGAGMAAKHGGLGKDTVAFCAPLNMQQFAPDRAARLRMRAEWGFADEDIVVGTLGNRGWQKRHELLVEVAASLRDRPDVKLALLGGAVDSNEAYYDRAVRRPIYELGLSDKVKVIDQNASAAEIMNGFDIFALPSVAEGASLVTAEAMATGLPVVATDVGSLCDIVQPGRNGFLVKDGAEMAAAIRRLAGDAALRAAYGAESISIARSDISAEKCASAHVAAYEMALKG